MLRSERLGAYPFILSSFPYILWSVLQVHELLSHRFAQVRSKDTTDSVFQVSVALPVNMNNAPGEAPMEGQTLPTLSDDLIIKIIASMLFPSVIKASSLSKEWRYRLLPVGAVGDDAEHGEEERRLAASFQEEMQKHRAKSSLQRMFYPVHLDKELCLTYDWAWKKWVRLPSLSFLPESILEGARISLAGPGLGLVTHGSSNYEEPFIVANTFMRTWKQLPPRSGYTMPLTPDQLFSCGRPRLVVDSSTGLYKVVAFSGSVTTWFVNIYESKTNAWRASTKLRRGIPEHWTFAFLNNVMYIVTGPHLEAGLFAVKVEEGKARMSSEILPLRYNNPVPTHLGVRRHLVVWDEQLFMIVHDASDVQVLILKVDPESRQLYYVSIGPPNPCDCDKVRTTGIRLLSAQGSRVLFKHVEWPPIRLGLIWEYDLLRDRWTRLEFPPLRPMSLIEEAGSSKLLTLSENLHTRRPTVLTFEPGLDPSWRV